MIRGRSRGVWSALALATVVVFASAGLASAAQGEVGMDAQGVDPTFVLRNAWGLDVRDALNRPVSRRKLESELKAAAASSAADAAYASRLPQARAAALALELLKAVQATLAAALATLPVRQLWGLPAPRPGDKAPALAVFLAGLLLTATTLRARSGALDLSRRACRMVVLRC